MYFIASGAVASTCPAARSGSAAAISSARSRWSPAGPAPPMWALGYCSLLTLFAGDFARLLAEDSEMKRTIDEVARQRLGVS